jgi:hypothetical protein
MKILSFIRRRPPSDPVFGYSDPCELIIDDKIIEKVDGRSGPNGRRPKDGKIWDLCYGMLALGIFRAKYQKDNSGRLCFVINDGNEVPAVLPNPNHDYRHVVTKAECHCGYREDDPTTPQNEDLAGSAACLVIRPSHWGRITQHVVEGEEVIIEIRGL